MPEPVKPGLSDYIRRLAPGTYGTEIGGMLAPHLVSAARAARPYVAPPPQMRVAPQVEVPQSTPEQHIRRSQRDFANAGYDYEQDQKAVLSQLAEFLTYREDTNTRGK